jgi:hypothetical protein
MFSYTQALSALITCWCYRDCLFPIPRGIVMAFSRLSNRRVGATVLWSSAML